MISIKFTSHSFLVSYKHARVEKGGLGGRGVGVARISMVFSSQLAGDERTGRRRGWDGFEQVNPDHGLTLWLVCAKWA